MGSDKKIVMNNLNHSYMIAANQKNAENIVTHTKPTRDIPNYTKPTKISDETMSVAITTTKLCNMRCTYCYAMDNLIENDAINTNNMNFEEIKYFFDKQLPADKYKSISITYMGGEALVNFKTVYEVQQYIKSTYDKTKFHVTTNGLLLEDKISKHIKDWEGDEIIADWFNDNGISIKVSCDGPKEIHDRTRIFGNGKGSYDKLFDMMYRLKKTHPRLIRRIQWSCTGDYGQGGPLIMRDKLIFFNNLLKNGLGVTFHLREAIIPGYTPEQLKEWSSNLEQQLDIAVDWFLSKTHKDKSIKWPDLTNNYLRNFLTPRPKMMACGAGRNYITIGFNGEIHACQCVTDCKIGDAETGIDPKLRAPWLTTGSGWNPNCLDCDIRGVCAGTCPQHNKTHSETNDVDDNVEMKCVGNKLRMKTAMRLVTDLDRDHLYKLINKPVPERYKNKDK